MFGSVNLLGSANMGSRALAKSSFTPIDLVGTLGLSYFATGMACDNDEMRITADFMDVIPEDVSLGPVTIPTGFARDFRFYAGLLGAGAAHFMQNNERVVSIGHDIAIASWSSLLATEVCRSKADAMDGDANIDMLGLDVLDDDLVGLEEYVEVGSMNFAYGW
jgi:hypothetical protein